MRLQTNLYSRKQNEKEGTAIFLHQKYLLALRLRPEASENEIVAILLEYLRPAIIRAIRASAPTSFTEHFNRAVEAEIDELDETSKKETRREENKVKTASPEPVNYTAGVRHVPPCNYFPKRHFYRGFPVFDSAPNSNNQGNWRGAGANKAVAGPSTSNNQQ